MNNQENLTQEKPQRLMRGQVISDKMDKTIVVKIERKYIHSKFKKVMRATKNYKVHDEGKLAKVGDMVEIFEGKPKSKTKYMYLAQVIEKGK